MDYKKAVKSITEMAALGYSEWDLKNDVHARDQDFAWKSCGGGKWHINHEKYDNYLRRKRKKRSA